MPVFNGDDDMDNTVYSECTGVYKPGDTCWEDVDCGKAAYYPAVIISTCPREGKLTVVHACLFSVGFFKTSVGEHTCHPKDAEGSSDGDDTFCCAQSKVTGLSYCPC